MKYALPILFILASCATSDQRWQALLRASPDVSSAYIQDVCLETDNPEQCVRDEQRRAHAGQDSQSQEPPP